MLSAVQLERDTTNKITKYRDYITDGHQAHTNLVASLLKKKK
jgi:hypothetical protein